MNCKNCGMQNTLGEKFCKNCGCLLQSDEITNNIPTPNANVDKIVMPNMKKYAIFSIIYWSWWYYMCYFYWHVTTYQCIFKCVRF